MTDSEKSQKILVSAMTLAMDEGVCPDCFCWCMLQTAALGYREGYKDNWSEVFSEHCSDTVKKYLARDEGEEE